MPRLTPDQLRFEIRRGLQTLSRSVLLDLGRSTDVRERALDQATTTMVGRLDGYEVVAPEPQRMDFGDMKNG
jgi:hypothetical protein